MDVETKSAAAGTPMREPSTPKNEQSPPTMINTPGNSAIAKVETPDTFEVKQTDDAPPAEQTPSSQTSKPENERPKRGARRALFTEDKDAQGTTPDKKYKKKKNNQTKAA